jgi:cytochrome P450
VTLAQRSSAPARPPGPPFRPSAVLQLLRRDTPPWRFVEIGQTFPRIASLRLGTTPVYLVTHPDLVREVLVVQARSVEKGPALKGAGVVLGDGLLTMPNERHKARRRLVNPAFHHSRLAGYATTIRRSARTCRRAGRPGSVNGST